MPQRPRSHELEEMSRNRLRELFTNVGWVVEDLRHDYGEDLLVRIFEYGHATPYLFFIQAKATDSIDSYVQKNGKFLSFPIDTNHLSHWGKFWEPVILTLWDAKSGITYWQSIQEFMEKCDEKRLKKKHLYIDIPINNVLDNQGLKNIEALAKARIAQFELEREGSGILVDLLEHALDAEISYCSGGVIYIKKSDEIGEVYLFGPLAEEVSILATYRGISQQECVSHLLAQRLQIELGIQSYVEQ